MSNRVFTKSVSILFMTENIVLHKSKDETTSERDKNKAKHT
jgi:hypothetical protein